MAQPNSLPLRKSTQFSNAPAFHSPSPRSFSATITAMELWMRLTTVCGAIRMVPQAPWRPMATEMAGLMRAITRCGEVISAGRAGLGRSFPLLSQSRELWPVCKLDLCFCASFLGNHGSNPQCATARDNTSGADKMHSTVCFPRLNMDWWRAVPGRLSASVGAPRAVAHRYPTARSTYGATRSAIIAANRAVIAPA
jgi:hypothetical protein